MFNPLALPLLTLTALSTSKPLIILPHPTPASLQTPTQRNVSAPQTSCFPARSQYVLHEARIDDCRQLVRDIAILGRSGRPYIFGTADTPHVDFTVPTTFGHRSCMLNVVEMDSMQAASDTFTLRYLSQKLLRMAELCVLPAPHLGGEVAVGREVLALVVLGVEGPGGRDGFGVGGGDLRNGSLGGVTDFS